MTRHDHHAFAATDSLPLSLDPLIATQERNWLIPSAVLTAMLGLAAFLLMPFAGYDEIPAYFSRFLNWLKYMLVGAIFLLLQQMIGLRKAGEEDPLGALKSKLIANRAVMLSAVAGAMLAGMDMLFFMWIKPEVTAVAPFWADPLFADLDHALFGTDPWRLFEGMNLTFHAWAYSYFWAVAIMSTLVWVLAQRPSRQRSASLLCYFATWSLFGPVGQLLGSAAGPIFYRRIGLGDRFVELEQNIPEVTQQISSYLWAFHTKGELGLGAGISAMPSLHIATVTWIILSFAGAKSRLVWPAALFGLYIWAMSVALGWHYAVDGIAGAAGALACHAAARRFIEWRSRAKSGTLSLAAHFTGR